MDKSGFAHRLGLTVLAMALTLTTSAFAGTNNSGAQQVVVTNTGAQPVPVIQNKQYYQATQTIDCTQYDVVHLNFQVPAGKQLVLQYVNISAGAAAYTTETYGGGILADSLSYWSIPMQHLGGGGGNQWAGSERVQLTATQTLRVDVRRSSIQIGQCLATVSLSGELTPAP